MAKENLTKKIIRLGLQLLLQSACACQSIKRSQFWVTNLESIHGACIKLVLGDLNGSGGVVEELVPNLSAKAGKVVLAPGHRHHVPIIYEGRQSSSHGWGQPLSRSFLPFAVPDRVPMGIHGVSRKVPERVHGCQTRGLVIKAGGAAVYCSSRLSPTRFLIGDLRTPIVYPMLIQDFWITTFAQKLMDSLQISREMKNSAQNLLGKKVWV